MFQFKLTFKLESNFLPRELDRLLLSYLKAAVQNYSQEMYNSLYDKTKSIIKSYTYAYYLPGARWIKEDLSKILLNKNEFTIFFSDENEAELLMFFNAFQKMKYRRHPMNGNSMELSAISMIPLQEITDSAIVVKMKSPIIARRHTSIGNRDTYYTCEDEEFETVLKENVEMFLQKKNLKISTNNFSIQTIKGKKIVKDVFGKKADASIGIYKISGEPELLNKLLAAGIGARRSEGNGMFEVIE